MTGAPTPPRAPAASPAKSFWVGLFAGLMIAAFVVVAWSAWRRANRPVADPAVAAAFLSANRRADGVVETPSGLQYRILRPGTGPRPTRADTAMVTYVGQLTDGKVFDHATRPAALPVTGVVPGFAEALLLMQTGARYRIWIPPALAYGPAGAGPIPGNAVLVFDIELVAIRSPKATRGAHRAA